MTCPVCLDHIRPPHGIATTVPGVRLCSTACQTAWKTGFARNRIEAQR